MNFYQKTHWPNKTYRALERILLGGVEGELQGVKTSGVEPRAKITFQKPRKRRKCTGVVVGGHGGAGSRTQEGHLLILEGCSDNLSRVRDLGVTLKDKRESQKQMREIFLRRAPFDTHSVTLRSNFSSRNSLQGGVPLILKAWISTDGRFRKRTPKALELVTSLSTKTGTSVS